MAPGPVDCLPMFCHEASITSLGSFARYLSPEPRRWRQRDASSLPPKVDPCSTGLCDQEHRTVLHFAREDDHFHAMLRGCWRTLKPGGLLFCRLASTIGAEGLVRHLHDRWYAMADGTERYLVDEAMLMRVTNDLGAERVDPIKTTVVQNLRSMTTWVLRKR